LKLAQRIYPEVRKLMTPKRAWCPEFWNWHVIVLLINAGQDHVNHHTVSQMTKVTDTIKILTSVHF
jgi:hypothetical protein